MRKRYYFDLDIAKKSVKEYMNNLMVLTQEETEFLVRFEKGKYLPELLFHNQDILDRIQNHPMAIWKTR